MVTRKGNNLKKTEKLLYPFTFYGYHKKETTEGYDKGAEGEEEIALPDMMYPLCVNRNEIKKIGCEKKKMNTQRKIAVILMAAVVVMAVAVPMAFGDDAVTSATVTLSAGPVVNTVTVTPNPVTLNAGGNTEITVTAEVSHAESYELIETVVITNIDPSIDTVTPPISLLVVTEISDTTATYEGSFDIQDYTDADTYTVTVTATDFEENTDTNTGTFTVNELLAISVTNVGFCEVHPGGDPGTGSSTVTNQGNVNVVFEDNGPSGYNNNHNDGITWTGMAGTTLGKTISDNAITTTWNPATVINKGATGNTADVPFSLQVPLGTWPDVYTGSATFTPSKA